MTTLALLGRILFLAEDPALVAAQLAGSDLDRTECGPLRDEISTDEITPLPSLVYFDERLADHAYTGVKAGGALPIGVGAVRAGGFSVAVAGGRYGKGSSREHSPLAEKMAGIHLARIMRRVVPTRANSTEMADPRISLQKTPRNRRLRRSSAESMACAWGGTRHE